ncbi:MAG TPA: hypothetical protein VKR24_14335, partial [Candidatus Limnocylindrales bacterium]|nr:hypothetical protein [Candidatus Limnocylindrales bacterium]
PLYSARKGLGFLGIFIFLAAFLADQWPRQVAPQASLAGFIAPWTLLFAAATGQPRRAALFALTLGIVALGSLGPGWLPDESQVGQPPLPSIANLDLNLTDYELDVCIFDFSTAQDTLAASAGVNMFVERSNFMDPIPEPDPFPSDVNDPRILAWEAAVTAAARQDAEFVYGCAVGLNHATP